MAVVVASSKSLRFGDVVVCMPPSDGISWQGDVGVKLTTMATNVEVGLDRTGVKFWISDRFGVEGNIVHMPSSWFEGNFIFWDKLSEKEKFVIELGGRLR